MKNPITSTTKPKSRSVFGFRMYPRINKRYDGSESFGPQNHTASAVGKIMTSVNLDPNVERKLSQFKRRRNQLLITRGICAGIVAFLICLAVAAFVDWYWLLSDSFRWTMSIGSYGLVAVATWFAGLGKLLTTPSDEEAASLIEDKSPALRENLRSAVELAADAPNDIHDSLGFRRSLQGSVAGQMSHVKVANLLPIRLIAKWLLVAAGLVGISAALLAFGDTRIRQLATRAFFPGANIARVSRIKIEILQPTPQSLMMAENETVAIVVDVSGGKVNDVILETTSQSDGTTRQPMNGRTESEFAANIQLKSEPVEYRIFAGDAITQRFTIDTRSRPHVVAFHKTYQFPAYSQLPSQSITETNGDLIALSGSNATLSLELDQTVSTAELRISSSETDDVQTVPLNQSGARWEAEIPINEPSIYKVHLVSADTGFENIFAPKFEIKPQPDLIPKTGFVDQPEPTLLLPPNDILELKAMAEDDLPLVGLEQHYSINGNPWTTAELTLDSIPGTDGRNVTAEWKWDLLTHKLKSGDQIVTKLVATDRKGNVGESVPLRIVIASTNFDPDRHSKMNLKLKLMDDILSYAKLVEEQKATSLATIANLQKPSRTHAQKLIDQNSLLETALTQRERAAELVKRVIEVEREMPAGADAYDLELTGRVLARIQHDYANVADYVMQLCSKAPADPSTTTKEIEQLLDELKQNVDRLSDDAKSVSYHYQSLIGHNFLAAISADLHAVYLQQQRVVATADQSWDRLMRQQTVSIRHVDEVEKLIDEHQFRLSDHLSSQLNQLSLWLTDQRTRITNASESEEKIDELRRFTIDFTNQLVHRQKTDSLDGGLPNRLIGARRDFENRAGRMSDLLYRIGQVAREQNRALGLASESKDSAAAKRHSFEAAKHAAELNYWRSNSLEQFRHRRDLVQNRQDANSQFAADNGLTNRAARWLLSQHLMDTNQESKRPQHFYEIADAFRILEAGHNLFQTRTVVNGLVNQERWASQEYVANIDHPRQWDVINYGLELCSLSVRASKLEKNVADRIDELRWSQATRDANEKLSERRWKRDRNRSAANELNEIRDRLSTEIEIVKPALEQARATIAKFAPTIPEIANAAAEEVRKLENETIEVAEAAETSAQKGAASLSKLREKQREINGRLEDLYEALVEEANSQDLLKEDQRERARDADDSIAMINQPAEKMNRLLTSASQQETKDKQTLELSQAADQQEKTAKALEFVAKHFDDLKSGLDVAKSREELRQFEREIGTQREMNQQFDESERLAEMTNQDAAELLKDLEAELERNPAMQNELSEIARSSLENAENVLKDAAEKDKRIQRENERSDSSLQKEKKELADGLKELGNRASQLSRELVAQANSAAAQSRSEAARNELTDAQKNLNELASKAANANENELYSNLAQIAKDANETIKDASKALEKANAAAADSKEKKIHDNPSDLQREKKTLEQSRQRFREQEKRSARQLVRNADLEKRNKGLAVRNAQNQMKNFKNSLRRAEANLAKTPDDANRKRIVENEKKKIVDGEKKLAEAEAIVAQAQKKVDSVRAESDAIAKKPNPELKSKNPAAQLAEQYSSEAIEVAKSLQQKSKALLEKSGIEKPLVASKSQLANSQKQQEKITDDVKRTAEDIGRAARHEKRLKNETAASTLKKRASEVEQAAKNESTDAENQLAEAANQADASNPTEPKNASETSNSESGKQNAKAQKAVASAEKAFSDQAEQLANALDQLNAESQPNQEMQSNEQGNQESGDASEQMADAGQGSKPQSSQQANSSPQSSSQQNSQDASQQSQAQQSQAQQSKSEIARGKQLAQALDELDQQLTQSQPSASTQPAPNQAGASQPTPQGLSSLSQAAQAQQAAMARARSAASQQASKAMQAAFNPSQSKGFNALSEASANPGSSAEIQINAVNRNEKEDWGKLRDKSVDGASTSRSATVSPEYRKKVEAYFKVLAERAKSK